MSAPRPSSVPAVKESETDQIHSPSKHPKFSVKDILMGVCIVVVIVAIVILFRHTIAQKKHLSQQAMPSKPSTFQSVTAIEGAPVFQLNDVNIKSKWSLLSGKHPTVILSATVQEGQYPIDYYVFAYHLKNDPQWISVDATHKGNGLYATTLRDLENDATYEFCLYAVGKKQLFSSEIHTFSIPK